MAEQEKSFGKKILSFFIKDEPTASSPNQMAATSPVASSPAGNLPPSTTIVPGTVDAKFIDHFASVLEKTNQPGPDYFEFREALRSLSNLGLSEEKQFQAAWASFKAMGGITDSSVLRNSANQYVTALNTDREAFLKSVDQTLAERVGGLQTEQKNLQADNDAMTKQIAELQNRIKANNERLAQIGGEVDAQSSKINQNRSNFEATYASFVEQIKADIARIQEYLK